MLVKPFLSEKSRIGNSNTRFEGGDTEQVGRRWNKLLHNWFNKYYRKRLSEICMTQIFSDINWIGDCPMIRFDNLGTCDEFLKKFIFFNSYIYLEHKLIGCFYGRSWGFWGATNYTCRIGRDKIKFKNSCGGVLAINAKTRERLLLKMPLHKFASRISGEIFILLSNNSELTIHLPNVIYISQDGLPKYVRFVFANDVVIRVLLYGRSNSYSEQINEKCFTQAINPCDIDKLSIVQNYISLPMLLSLAMYLRVYKATRWLI